MFKKKVSYVYQIIKLVKPTNIVLKTTHNLKSLITLNNSLFYSPSFFKIIILYQQMLNNFK